MTQIRLRRDQTSYVPSAVETVGAVSLNGLRDVTITSVATDQILKHNGTNFVNVDLSDIQGNITEVDGGTY